MEQQRLLQELLAEIDYLEGEVRRLNSYQAKSKKSSTGTPAGSGLTASALSAIWFPS